MLQGPIHFRGVNLCSVYLKTESVILTSTKSVIITSGNNIYLGKSLSLPSVLGISSLKFLTEAGLLAPLQLKQTFTDV